MLDSVHSDQCKPLRVERTNCLMVIKAEKDNIMLDQAQNETLKEAKEYFSGFPEAPYSDSFKWVDANGFEHLSTVRSWTGGALLSGIEKATLAIVNKGGKPVSNKPAPAPSPESQKVQLTTEDGLPVVDAEQKPVMVSLPPGTHLFTVKEVFHDTNRDGSKHMLKVVVAEEYQYSNGKYGISCFHPSPVFTGWKEWPTGQRFAPPVQAAKVLIRDPKEGGKYADVVEFRA